jgi:hypothetical protein
MFEAEWRQQVLRPFAFDISSPLAPQYRFLDVGLDEHDASEVVKLLPLDHW